VDHAADKAPIHLFHSLDDDESTFGNTNLQNSTPAQTFLEVFLNFSSRTVALLGRQKTFLPKTLLPTSI